MGGGGGLGCHRPGEIHIPSHRVANRETFFFQGQDKVREFCIKSGEFLSNISNNEERV